MLCHASAKYLTEVLRVLTTTILSVDLFYYLELFSICCSLLFTMLINL
jgi:hypothetical protein